MIGLGGLRRDRAVAVRRPASLELPSRDLERANQLRFDPRQQQIIVVAQPPTEPADLQCFQGFFVPFRSDRRDEPLLQRRGVSS